MNQATRSSGIPGIPKADPALAGTSLSGIIGAVPRTVFLALLLSIGTSGGAAAQPEVVQSSRELFHAAAEAFQANDMEQYVANLEEGLRLRPNHPSFLYNLARGYALTGEPDKAIGLLQTYADLGLIAEPGNDDNLATLWDDPRFTQVQEIMSSNREPSGSGTVAFTLPERDLVPEGIAYDPVSDSFFISGIHKRKIVRRRKDGSCVDFTTSGQDGLWSVFALAVDPLRRHLWAGSAAMRQTPDADSLELGHSAVLCYDIDSGSLVRKVSLAGSREAPHILNDFCLRPSGTLYLADNQGGVIYALRPEARALEVVVPAGRLVSPQGITLDPSGDAVFVADYSTGVHRVDVADGSTTVLDPPESTTLLGIDGLVYHDGSLIAIQNGVQPHRVLQIRLNEDRTGVTGVSVLESNHPDFDEPTLGTIVDGWFYFVANSQWGHLKPDGGFVSEDALREPRILKRMLP